MLFFLPSSFNQWPPLHPQQLVCLRQIFFESQLVIPKMFRVLGLLPDQVPRWSSLEKNDHWSWSTDLLFQLSQLMHLCHLWKKRLNQEQLIHRCQWLFAWCFPQNVQELHTDEFYSIPSSLIAFSFIKSLLKFLDYGDV